MSSLAVRVENLGKRYRLGGPTGPYTYRSLRESVVETAQNLRRRAEEEQTLWALKDVSFEVKHGEAVGIVGRNGAGKSTLLKILSRITHPTTGRAEVRGRVGSLLEVGTGFHPELSGRENIYLNGAILGMSKRDIDRRFDEIVDFAELERFLETPVKRYSSGMYMRLAFSVAAHFEPDVLVIDEVLAVGDAQFQKKCLGKMGEVTSEGRTVLFVSHNMPAITRLCNQALLLSQGRVASQGPAGRIVGMYLSSNLGAAAIREWLDPALAPGNEIIRLRRVRVRTQEGETATEVDIRRPVGIDIEYDVLEPGWVLVPNLHVFTQERVCAFVARDLDTEWNGRTRPVGRFISTAWIPGNLLAEGTLTVDAAISTMNPVQVHVHERDVVALQVVDTMEGDSARGDLGGEMPGVVRPMLNWTTVFHPSKTLSESSRSTSF